ncbi:hypothetical protein MRB53_000484 [Persea americana]|uniref:Uncharacterized protein n=1 Tax=Persea americana TaxID=3435 RepID=A0ACC2MP74_PERAE|nr:hypothetical protein MRB53_000484 [Persea americana]
MPIKAGGIPSSMPLVDPKRIMTRQEVIKVKGALEQGELRRIKTTAESLKGTATSVGRRVTWRKIAGQRRRSTRVMLLLPKVKMNGMLKLSLLWKKRS